LYIGAAKSLIYRLSRLVQTHHPDYNGKGHRKFLPTLARRFSPEKLAITWERTNSWQAAYDREAELVRAYEEEFGEKPPHGIQ